MFAVLAAIAFALAFLFNGGAVTVASHWFDPAGLLYLGLVFLALHLARVLGLGNWRQG